MHVPLSLQVPAAAAPQAPLSSLNLDVDISEVNVLDLSPIMSPQSSLPLSPALFPILLLDLATFSSPPKSPVSFLTAACYILAQVSLSSSPMISTIISPSAQAPILASTQSFVQASALHRSGCLNKGVPLIYYVETCDSS